MALRDVDAFAQTGKLPASDVIAMRSERRSPCGRFGVWLGQQSASEPSSFGVLYR